MKTYFKALTAMCLAFGIVACTPKDDPTPTPGGETSEVKADFTFEVNGLDVKFTNACEGATTYKWDFGDGETSKEASPSHTYLSAGEYTVKLTAGNPDGVVSKAEKKVTVAGQVKAYFTYTVLDGRAGKYGKIVSFDATASANASSISWDFGDGQKGSEFKLDHEFAEFTTYTVKAEVKGADGSSDVFEATITLDAKTELLKGGEMNEGDEQYWTIVPIWADVADAEGKFDYEGDEGTPCWVATFGYTDDKPAGGEGGCLRLSSENQNHDFAYNFLMYQAIEVQEGDVLRVSAEMKWGENNNDDGLLWFGFSAEAPTSAGAKDGSAVIEMYNYWVPGTPIPAYDGNFAGNEEWLAANTSMELGYSGDGVTPYVDYTVEASGTLYFYMDYRNVWGNTYGPGRDMYFDNLSVRIVL